MIETSPEPEAKIKVVAKTIRINVIKRESKKTHKCFMRI